MGLLERTKTCRKAAVGAAGVALLLLTAGACGGDDDTASTTDATEPASCTERMVDIMSSDAMAAAADAGGDLPGDLQDQLDDIDADCGEVLDALSDEEMGDLLAEVPLKVITYLGESTPQEFEKTGSQIGG